MKETQLNQSINGSENAGYSNEWSKQAHELLERAREINPSITEDNNSKLKPIHFDKKHINSGLLVSMAYGPGVFTQYPGVVYVPERTAKLLEALNIPYNSGIPVPIEDHFDA